MPDSDIGAGVQRETGQSPPSRSLIDQDTPVQPRRGLMDGMGGDAGITLLYKTGCIVADTQTCLLSPSVRGLGIGAQLP